MKAGFFQFPPVFGDVAGNVEKVGRALTAKQVDLLVLPELFNTGYQFVSKDEVTRLSEEVPFGFTTQKLIEMSKEKNVHIVAGLAERQGDFFFNSAVLTGPEGFVGVYRKTHLFFEENLWFSPGDSGFRVWDTPAGRIGIMICFDWFFPESARTLALQGADIIAHPSNLVLPYCPDSMPTRCLENRVFAVTADRTGKEQRGGKESLEFIGTSEIVSPSGKVLFRAGRQTEELGIVEIDVTEARNKELNRFNSLFRDRRKDFYRS
ncbi:MAG: acyltransferase [Nitrospiraceae bacterium]|nr:acyltransferase [Nitrospiraceae bacterium]